MSIEFKKSPKNLKEEDVKKINEGSDIGNISKTIESIEIKINIGANNLKKIEDNSINSSNQEEKLNPTKKTTIDIPNGNIKITHTSSYNKDMRIQSEEKIKIIFDEKIKSPLKRSNSNQSFIKENSIEKIMDKMKSQDKNKQIISKSSYNNNISIVNNANSDDNINFIKEEEIQNVRNYIEYEEVDEKTIAEKIMKKINFEEIIKDIKKLLNKKVIIKKIVDYEFITEEDFQIMNKKESSKLPFIINLQNYIIILNSILFYVEKDVSEFHNLLKIINSKFSYVERKEENVTYFGFLTQVSKNIYSHFLSKGDFGIEDEKLKSLGKIYYESNKVELGYLFEESTQIYLLNEIGEKNFIEYPSIIYYLNKTGVNKFFEKNIFKYPKIYILEDKNQDESNFSGFNKIDICLKIKNDTHIQQNYHFNIVNLPEKKVYEKYNPISEEAIELKKDIIYFIEIKRNTCELEKKETIDKIINKSIIFIQLYKNNVYNHFNDENKIKFENIFIYNSNRKNVVDFSEGRKKIKIYFSDKDICLNSISSLNANIHDLYLKTDSLEKEVNSLEQKINYIEKEMEKEENDRKQLKSDFNSFKTFINNKINPKQNYSRFMNLVDSVSIENKHMISYVKNLYNTKYNLARCFNFIADNYNECGFYFDMLNDELFDMGVKFMMASKNRDNKDLKLKIMDFLENKIKNSHFPEYFKALKKLIFGENFEKTKNKDNLEYIFNKRKYQYGDYYFKKFNYARRRTSKKRYGIDIYDNSFEISIKTVF